MSSPVRSRFPFALATILATLAIVTLITLVGPPAAEAQRKKVLNIAAKEPDTLDPHSSTLGQSQAITRFMFRGLTRFAIKDGKVTTAEVEPDLAESWTLSPEGTIWTFKLKKGVQFHKGFGEMTAEDVKFSFERQINKTPGTRYGVNLDVIKSIEVVDPYTVQIALKSFDAIFLLRMVGYQQGYIVSKKAATERRAVQVEPRRHRALLLRPALAAGEDRPQGLRQVRRRPAPDRRGPLVRRARGRHQADRPREGHVRPALSGGGHRRLRRPGEEDGRRSSTGGVRAGRSASTST